MSRKFKIGACFIVFLVISSVGFICTLYFFNLNRNFPILNASREIRPDNTYRRDSPITVSGIWGDNSHLYICGNDNYGVFISKWDKNGNFMWNQTWNYSNETEVATAIWGNNDSVFISGNIRKSSRYYSEGVGFIAKWDKNGTFRWYRKCNITNYDQLNDVWGDENSVFACGSINRTLSSEQMLLIKWDQSGQKEWEYRANMRNPLDSIKGDSKYIYGSADNMSAKWDKEGNLIWNKTTNRRGGDIWISTSDIFLMTESMILCGTLPMVGMKPGGPLKLSICLSKWDKEGINIWNETKSVQNRYYDGFLLPKSQLWCYDSAIFSYEDIYIDKKDDWAQTQIVITRYDLNGKTIWNTTCSGKRINYQSVHSMNIWGDEHFVYSFHQFIDLESLRIETYFSRWFFLETKLNASVITSIYSGVGLLIITDLWFVIQPLKRVQQRKSKKLLRHLRDNLNASIYDNEELFRQSLIIIERYGNEGQLEEWFRLKKRQDINQTIQKRFREQVCNIDLEDQRSAYNKFISILHDANIPEYADIIDRCIISDITETLKHISNKIYEEKWS